MTTMDRHDPKAYPHLRFEENRCALERERRLRQQIRAVRAAQRAERPSRYATLTSRLRALFASPTVALEAREDVREVADAPTLAV